METPLSSSTSNSSQHYASLLDTVSSLRHDLERTVAKIATLESHNESLQANYSSTKEELIDTRVKLKDAQENYMATVEDRVEAERGNEIFMDRLKSQLAEKTKEFESLREKFAPQDIDYIRINIQAELEAPHKQRIHSLMEDIDKQKELYNAMKREGERCKAEYDTYAQNHHREVMAVREENETEIRTLRLQIANLQDNSYHPEKTEQLRQCKLKLHEMEQTISGLHEEVKSLQLNRDEVLAGWERDKLLHNQAVAGLRSRVTVLSAEKDVLDQRLSHASIDAAAREQQLRTLKKTSDEQHLELEGVKVQCRELTSKLGLMKENHDGECKNLQLQHDEELHRLQKDVEAAHYKLNEREDFIRDTQREMSHFQSRAECNEQDIRRTYELQIKDLKYAKSLLDIEMYDVQQNNRNAQDRMASSEEQYAADKMRLSSEVSRLTREKEVLKNKHRDLEDKYDTMNKKNTINHRSLSEKIVSLKKDNKEMQNLYNERMKESDKNATQLRVDQASLIEAIQLEAKGRYDALTMAFNEKLTTFQAKSSKMLEKERNRSAEYKKKAVDCHEKNKALTATVNALQDVSQFHS